MAKMRISPELKKLIEKYRCVKDTEGMSPAKVYKLVGENENLYLKMTDSRYKGTTYDVEREKDMMLWLEGKLPVPKVLHFERHDGWSNLLMSEADGVLCSEEYIRTQFGSDINAACGQLAGAYRDDQKQGERTMSARDVKSFGEEVEASC